MNNTGDTKEEKKNKFGACPIEINKPWSNYQTGDD